MKTFEAGKLGWTGSTHARRVSDKSKTLCGRDAAQFRPTGATLPSCGICKKAQNKRVDTATAKVAEALRSEQRMHVELWESTNLDTPETFESSARSKVADASEIRTATLDDANWLRLWAEFNELNEDEPKPLVVGAHVRHLVHGYVATLERHEGGTRWIARTEAGVPVQVESGDLRAI